MRAYTALVASDVSLFRPVFLLPMVSFLHIEQANFFATSPLSSDSSTFSATLTGTSPLYRTRLSFATGYSDAWSSSSPTHMAQIFGRAADAFRLGSRTFGNLTIDTTHQLGVGTSNVSLLAALVWSFRESSVSASYQYALTLPAGSASHSLALLFTRSFETSFLPEAR